jgi:hypothetical protein
LGRTMGFLDGGELGLSDFGWWNFGIQFGCESSSNSLVVWVRISAYGGQNVTFTLYKCTRICIYLHFLYQYNLEAQITNPTCPMAFNIASHVSYSSTIFQTTPLLLVYPNSIHQYIDKYMYMYTNIELHQLLYHVSFDHRSRGTSIFAEANEGSVVREGFRVWSCVEGCNVGGGLQEWDDCDAQPKTMILLAVVVHCFWRYYSLLFQFIVEAVHEALIDLCMRHLILRRLLRSLAAHV